MLPGSVGDSGVTRGEVGPGDLEVQRWLAHGFVAHVNQRFRFGFAAGPEAGLPAGRGVLAVERVSTTEQDEPLLHDWFKRVNQFENRALASGGRVSVEFSRIVGEWSVPKMIH